MKKIYILILLTLFLILPHNAYSEWKTYFFSEGNYSLDITQKPERKVAKQKTLKNIISSYFYQSCLDNCVIAYTTTYADFGKDSHVAKNPKDALEFSKLTTLKNTNGELTYESYIDYKGYPGKENKFNIDTHQGLYVLIQRVYIINGKTYEMNVSTPIKNQFMPEHYKFLDSFKKFKL